MNADHYYGSTARDYDKKRCSKPDWQLEQDAVKRFVTKGPVLDCPIGTGRYVQIYKDKRMQHEGCDVSEDMIAQARAKHPDLKAQVASALSLPYEDKQFNTVVNSRLLNWLYPEEMARAVQELRRVGKVIVTSIRTGEKGHHAHQGNYTHSYRDFLAAFDGMLICDKQHLLKAPDGSMDMYRMRKPVWDDVVKQFKHHKDGRSAIARLASDWITSCNLNPVDVYLGKVTCENWSNERIAKLIYRMAESPLENNMITDDKPRYMDGPLTIIRTQGREFMLDGRRRSNIFMNTPGWHQVLVISV